jgi:para-aminobenzoate synthetase
MKPEVLLIDNVDSFTYNLCEDLRCLGARVHVFRNDLSLSALLTEVASRKVTHMVISPGPGRPETSGATVAALRSPELAQMPVLGVCLGMQALAWVHGGTIDRLPEPVHGRATPVSLQSHPLFAGLSSGMVMARYHSLYVSEVPSSCRVLARSEEVPMALEHETRPHYGVQFHPESIMSEHGQAVLRNFLSFSEESHHATC